MPDTSNFWTTHRPDGTWGVKQEGANQPLANFETQAQAWQLTQALARQSHGEAFLQNRHGQIRERNTYGHDPESSKG